MDMNFALYQVMNNELKLRAENKTGKLANISTEQLKQLVSDYEKEIALYAMIKMLAHNNKLERCEV